jgi:hypothetical protein
MERGSGSLIKIWKRIHMDLKVNLSVPAQRFLSVHATVYNLFNLGRHLISAKYYRLLRQRAFASWNYATAV